MITIRSEQMASLSAGMMAQFELRNLRRLRATYPEATAKLDDAALGGWIRGWSQQARHYGIRAEADIEAYFDCAMVYGPKFDTAPERPWIRRILSDASLTGEQKMDRIGLYPIFGDA